MATDHRATRDAFMNQSSAFSLDASLGRLCSKDLQTEYKKYDIDRLALFDWEVVDVVLFSKVLPTICLHMK